jgi:hypothetical protein
METYSNSFHNSEAHSRQSRDELEAAEYRYQSNPYSASAADCNAHRTIQRIARTLCPSPECTCGQNLFGERG